MMVRFLTPKRILLSTSLLALMAVLAPTSSAQYYFGRNKIQYDDFKWKILKTEHFDVYFYPEMRELAEIGAGLAEDAYRRLEAKTNHNILRRIPLIFYSNHSHFQQTNTIPNFIPEGVGGFFEFLKGRVVIPANGSIPKFQHVINHELVHVFTRSKMNRVLKNHRKTKFAGMPLWFTEGLAEYWSTGWDSQAELILRDAVLSGHLVPLSRMDAIYGTFLMYKEGQAICKYIAETFGEEKLLQLIENLWKEARFSDVMKLTIGLDYKAFDEKWLYYLKKTKYPLLEDGDSPRMTTQAITKVGLNTKPACYTINGEDFVAFSGNRTGYSSIYVKPLDGETKNAEAVVESGRTSDFESFHLLSSKIDVNQKGELAFVSKSGAGDVLYVIDIATKEKLKEFDFNDLVALFSPNWSPDDRRLVFTGISYAGRSDLYVVDVESAQLERLTNDFYDDRDPVWSPGGNSIAFSSDRSYHGESGFMNLFIYNLPRGSIQYLTAGPHNDYAPSWSPSGKELAFSSDRDGSFNIWVLQGTGSGLQELTQRQPSAGSVKQPTNGRASERLASDNFAKATVHNQILTPGSNGRHVKNGHGGNGRNGHPATKKNSVFDEPAGLNSFELRQITNYVTGALDPTWVDDESILFTAFENFSFQIQKIDNLRSRIQDASVTVGDSLDFQSEHWTANKLAGEVESTTLKYKQRLSLDIAQSAISQDPIFGLSGGAQLAMSDMLSNKQYYFLLFNNAQTRGDFLTSWNLAVTRVELGKRVNYAIGGYHITGRFFDQVDSYFDQRRLGGYVAASFPFSVFRRIEASVNIRKETTSYATRGQVVDGIVVSNSISYVKDNALWGATGPIDGERFKLTLGHSIDVQHNDLNFYTIIADYRRYTRLGLRSAYALRLMTRLNIGRESFRYFMGGSWDLRLWPRWRTWGRKMFLMNHELRFPFIDRFLVGFPVGGLGFNAIRGALFADLGQAWDSEYEFNEVLGSLGFGMRFRLGGFLVLRFEIGRRFRLRNFSSPKIRFDEGVKKAFWFGFDF